MSDGITSLKRLEPAVSSASTFPTDGVAVIYRPARSAMTSGTANSRKWKLRFERRSHLLNLLWDGPVVMIHRHTLR